MIIVFDPTIWLSGHNYVVYFDFGSSLTGCLNENSPKLDIVVYKMIFLHYVAIYWLLTNVNQANGVRMPLLSLFLLYTIQPLANFRNNTMHL